MALCEAMFSAGVYIVPSTALFGEEPGWFRITFTMKPPLLDEGLNLGFSKDRTGFLKLSTAIKNVLEANMC